MVSTPWGGGLEARWGFLSRCRPISIQLNGVLGVQLGGGKSLSHSIALDKKVGSWSEWCVCRVTDALVCFA